MTEDQAKALCATLGDEAMIERLQAFTVLLAEENTRQNLVSGASLANVWQRHIADSLQLLFHVPAQDLPWLDLGTGAGFPGLAIAIARPESQVVMVESRKRRVDFLVEVADTLGLKHVRVVGSKLEAVPDFAAGVISARAFAPLEKLLSLSARFSTPATYWLLPKGRSSAQELAQQPAPIRAMFHVKQSQTDPEGGILIGQGRPALS